MDMFFTLFQRNWLKTHWKKLIFLVLLVLICYIPTLNHAFLSDDIAVIQNNPHIGDFGYALIRPQSALRTLLYTTIFTISGYAPLLYRLSNVLFHVGSVLLLYATVEVLGFETIALFAAALFAVHPLVIESVTWISGGTYSQYGFFFLASLFFYIRSRKSNSSYLISLLFFGLSLWSSEKAIMLPIVLLWYELCLSNVKKNYTKLFAFFTLAFGFGLFYFSQVGQRVQTLETNFYQKTEALNPFFQIPIAISTYLSLFFVPLGLTFYHSELFFSNGEFIIRLISLISLIGLIGFAFWKQKFIAFWLGFFVIILAPTLTPLPIAWIVAERYMYLGVAGLCVVVGWVLDKTVKPEKTRYVGYAMFAIITIVLMGITLTRNGDWQNQDTLWLATAKTSPNSPQNHNNLGDLYARRGNLDQAVIEFKQATELNPNYGDAFHNLGNTYQQKRDIPNAIKYYKKAISINPNLWQSYQNMAYLFYIQKKYADAEAALRKALSIAPNVLNVRKGLVVVLLKEGKENEAQEIMQQPLQ